MLLRRVRLEHFGVLRGPLELRLGPGLNVLHGPNECGKTTLQKALFDAFTLRAKTTGKELERFKPRDGGTPEIDVEFEHGGTPYALHKRFAGSGGTARLTWAGGDLAGDAAEARLRELFGLGEAAKGRGDTGIWPIVWIDQGSSDQDPTEDVPERARSLLSEELARVTGTVLAGAGTEGLFERVREEFAKFFTATGAWAGGKGKPYGEAQQALADAQATCDALERKQKDYEALVDQHERLAEQVRGLAQKLPSYEEAARLAQVEADALAKLKQTLQTARAQAESARLLESETQQRIVRREALRKAVQGAEAKAALALEARNGAEIEAAAHAGGRAPLEEALSQATRQAAEVERQVRRARFRLDELRAAAQLAGAEKQLADARALEKQLLVDEARRKQNKATPAALEEIQALHDRRTRAEAAVRVAASNVRVRALRSVRIAADGGARTLEEGQQFEQLAKTQMRLTVGDLAEIEISPGGKDLAKLGQEFQKADEELRAKLAALDAPDVAAARRLGEERRDLQSDIESARRLLQTLAPRGVEALAGEVELLRARAADAARGLAAITTPADAVPAADDDAAAAAVDAAERAVAQASEARESASAARMAHDRRQGELETQRRLAVAAAEQAAAEQAAATRDLAAHVEALGPDEALAAAHADRLAHGQKARDALCQIEARLSEADADQVEDRRDRTAKSLDAVRQEKTEKEKTLAGTRALLGAGDLIGLHERLADARARLEQARREQGRVEERGRAARLLAQTLSACRDEARQRFTAPLRDEALPLLRLAFPNARVDFDEQFRLVELVRDDRGRDAFRQLSGGAKEQVGVILRLAMAKVLAAGGPLPVVLDDGLTATDDGRFERMTAVLRRASRDLQLVLLTCHWERYRLLGAEPDQVTDLESALQATRPRAA